MEVQETSERASFIVRQWHWSINKANDTPLLKVKNIKILEQESYINKTNLLNTTLQMQTYSSDFNRKQTPLIKHIPNDLKIF